MAENNVHGIKGEYRRLTAAEVGLMIRLARKQKGIKRAVLAAEAHMSEKTLERAESGRGISEESSRRIAQALGFQEDTFVAELYVPEPGEFERMQKKQLEELRATHVPQAVAEINGTRDLLRLFRCELFFTDDTHVAEEDLETFAGLKDSLWEGNAIHEELSELERLRVAQSFLDEIHSFQALGYIVKAGIGTRHWEGGEVSVAIMTAFVRNPQNEVGVPSEVWLPKKMSVGF